MDQEAQITESVVRDALSWHEYGVDIEDAVKSLIRRNRQAVIEYNLELPAYIASQKVVEKIYAEDGRYSLAQIAADYRKNLELQHRILTRVLNDA